MMTQSVIVGISITAGTLYLIWRNLKREKKQPDTSTTPSSQKVLTVKPIQNDKLVLVNNIDYNELQTVLKNFCQLYNANSYQILGRVYKITDKKFIISFPFDLSFEIFCYFINYVHYPEGFNKSMDVTGWATIKIGDSWIAKKAANKKVMLYIPANDTEYDNVFISTNENVGFKIGFGMNEAEELDSPDRQFFTPAITLSELENKEFEEFK